MERRAYRLYTGGAGAIYKQIQIQTRDELTCYPIAYPNYVFVTTSNIKGADTIKRTPVFEDYTKLTME